jgi:predicted transcriptional regulator
MTQVYHRTVEIYSSFAQCWKIPHLVKMLYLFVRSHDKQHHVPKYQSGEAGKGAGKVGLDLPMLARTFNRSVATIKKALRLAYNLGIFWLLEIKGDGARLIYTSLKKVCSKLNISNLGAIFEMDALDMPNQVRSQVVIATTAQKQEASFYAAKRETKENNKKYKGKKLAKHVKKSQNIFKSASTFMLSGVKGLKIKGRFLLVHRLFVPYGVSQDLVAELVNRTPQTVRKHLKGIKRYQVCEPCSDAISTPEFWLTHNLGEKHYMRFDGDRTLYQAKTNIYDLESKSLRRMHLRKRVSKYTRSAPQSPANSIGA